MWDLSYHMLIQLSGPKATLLTRLNTLTSDHTGQVFSFIPGESSATLFRPEQYPHGVVGKVSYIWRPSTNSDRETLWIWCCLIWVVLILCKTGKGFWVWGVLKTNNLFDQNANTEDQFDFGL